MKEITSDPSAKPKKSRERAPYEPPTIIYEGLITTRAATTGGGGGLTGGGGSSAAKSSSGSGGSAVDIFSEDN